MSYQEYDIVAKEASWGFSFAQRLRQLLERNNIKVSQFARQTGIKKSSLDRYLSGLSIPNYFKVKVIADALGMTVEKLVDFSPDADLLSDCEDDWDYEEEDDCEDFT